MNRKSSGSFAIEWLVWQGRTLFLIFYVLAVEPQGGHVWSCTVSHSPAVSKCGCSHTPMMSPSLCPASWTIAVHQALAWYELVAGAFPPILYRFCASPAYEPVADARTIPRIAFVEGWPVNCLQIVLLPASFVDVGLGKSLVCRKADIFGLIVDGRYYLPTPPLGQDMTRGQFLSGV